MTTLAPPANCEPQIPGVGMVPYRPFRVAHDDRGNVRNCAANMMLLRGSKVAGTTWQLQWIVANARPWLAAILTAVSTSPAMTKGAPSAPKSTKAISPSHMLDLR